MAIYLEAVQVDHSWPGKYRLGLDLKLMLSEQPLLFLWPRDRTSAERAKSFPLCVPSRSCWNIVCSLALSVFWEVIASRTMLDQNPMEEENVIDERTLGGGDLADRLHRLTKICTTTTSTSQVSWQHPLLENPIRHCIISRTASAL